MRAPSFTPEQFTLDQRAVTLYELDTEVASYLVNQLDPSYSLDPKFTRDPTQHQIVIDPTGSTVTHAPYDRSFEDKLKSPTEAEEYASYRASFSVDSPFQANQSFLPAVMKAISQTERRAGLRVQGKDAAIAWAGMSLLIGAGLMSKEYPFSNIGLDSAEYTAIASSALGGLILPIGIRNRLASSTLSPQARRTEKRINAAQQLAIKLKSPPVVRPIPSTITLAAA